MLLVDADPAVQELVTGMLKREDRKIEAAYDGQDALKKLRGEPFDVVIAGPGRNGDDGLNLVRKVRTIQPETRVIVTGDPDPKRIIGALRKHAYSYIHQPLDHAPLNEVVTLALESTAWQDDLRVISAIPEWISLDVRCKIDAAERTTQFFRELVSDLPHQTRDDITVAFRELLMNGVEHGGKGDPKKRVRASLVRTPRSLIAHVHDPGQGFSLDLLPHAAISNPEDSPIRHVEIRAEEGRRPGGFGILMTRNLVDELLYNEKGNAVLFVKYL